MKETRLLRNTDLIVVNLENLGWKLNKQNFQPLSLPVIFHDNFTDRDDSLIEDFDYSCEIKRAADENEVIVTSGGELNLHYLKLENYLLISRDFQTVATHVKTPVINEDFVMTYLISGKLLPTETLVSEVYRLPPFNYIKVKNSCDLPSPFFLLPSLVAPYVDQVRDPYRAFNLYISGLEKARNHHRTREFAGERFLYSSGIDSAMTYHAIKDRKTTVLHRHIGNQTLANFQHHVHLELCKTFKQIGGQISEETLYEDTVTKEDVLNFYRHRIGSTFMHFTTDFFLENRVANADQALVYLGMRPQVFQTFCGSLQRDFNFFSRYFVGAFRRFLYSSLYFNSVDYLLRLFNFTKGIQKTRWERLHHLFMLANFQGSANFSLKMPIKLAKTTPSFDYISGIIQNKVTKKFDKWIPEKVSDRLDAIEIYRLWHFYTSTLQEMYLFNQRKDDRIRYTCAYDGLPFLAITGLFAPRIKGIFQPKWITYKAFDHFFKISFTKIFNAAFRKLSPQEKFSIKKAVMFDSPLNTFIQLTRPLTPKVLANIIGSGFDRFKKACKYVIGWGRSGPNRHVEPSKQRIQKSDIRSHVDSIQKEIFLTTPMLSSYLQNNFVKQETKKIEDQIQQGASFSPQQSRLVGLMVHFDYFLEQHRIIKETHVFDPWVGNDKPQHPQI